MASRWLLRNAAQRFAGSGLRGAFLHPAQHGALRNLEAKHLQLSVNTRCTPGRVLGDHAEDEFTQFHTDTLSSHTVSIPREPRPIQLEACVVPTNNSLRLDQVSTLTSILSRVAATVPRTISQRRRDAVEDADVSGRQVVAGEPDSLVEDRGESHRVGKPNQPRALTNEA